MRAILPGLFLALCSASALADGAGWTFGVDEAGRFGVVAAESGGAASIEVPADWSGEPVRAIGADAFAACDGLEEVRIPASVEWIDPYAFRGCPSLAGVEVERGSPEYSSRDGMLFDESGLFLLNCPEGRAGECIVPDGTAEIDAGAFAGCAGLSSVVLPPGLDRTGDGAFSGCAGLRTLFLPKSLPFRSAAAGVPSACRIVRYAPGGLDDPRLPPRWAVSFAANGGRGSMAGQTFRRGTAAALRANAFVRTGFVFAGWSRTAGGAIAFRDGQTVRDLAAAGATVRLHAVWAVRRYRVVFLANGGKGTMRAQPFVYGRSKRLRANAFSRKGRTFVGWARKASAKATIADRAPGATLTRKGGTVRLFAKWRRNRYAVRFRPNGGSGTMPDEAFVYGKRKALSPNGFSRKGRRFLGWSRKPGATLPSWKDGEKVLNLTARDGRTVVLYAVWSRPIDPDRILCLGDSITEGYACAGLPYPSRLARLTGRKVVNRGVGGTTARDGLRTAEANILSARAGTVCILFGSNDAIHGVDPASTKESLRKIVRLCRSHGCSPVLGTPPHQSGRHARFDDGVSDVVADIRSLAREEGVPLADVHAAFGHRDAFLNPDDGLHLSDAGGDLLARAFRDALP